MPTSLILRRHERPALRVALESAGFLVFDASGGGRERERLREFWAALILLDLPMPRMGGLEIFRRLRGAGDHDPEAIIVTHGPIPVAIAAVRLGALDVLVRPMTTEAIRAAVEGIVRVECGPGLAADRPRILVAVDPLAFVLLRAKRALDRREFDEAERLLRAAIERDPGSAVAHNLMGLLHERLGEHHASGRSFRAALRADRCYAPALENLRRYGDRFGPDFHARAVPVAPAVEEDAGHSVM
jgi:DNA-binding response OmpR family regulator